MNVRKSLLAIIVACFCTWDISLIESIPIEFLSVVFFCITVGRKRR